MTLQEKQLLPVATMQPLLLAVGSMSEGVQDVYVVSEKKFLMKASKNTHAIPLLFSTFLYSICRTPLGLMHTISFLSIFYCKHVLVSSKTLVNSFYV